MGSEAHNLTVIEGGLSVDNEAQGQQQKGSKSWGSTIRRRAKELIRELDTSYMELARILYEVWDTPVDGNPMKGGIFTSWGYQSFHEYASAELGLEQRKAERLRMIWYVLEVQCKTMDQKLKQRIVALGYTKVRELVSVLTTRNAETWCTFAEGVGSRELEQSIRNDRQNQKLEAAAKSFHNEEMAGAPAEALQSASAASLDRPIDLTPPEALAKETFALFPAQHENVRLALEKAGKMIGSEKKGHRLDMICLDFLATNDFMGEDLDKRLRYIAKIERTLGLRLVAVDPKTKDIVYGINSLKLVAGE